MLLSSAPDEARAIVDEVRRMAPPEPQAGEASLLLGRCFASAADWLRAMEIFTALKGSRTDEIGAQAAVERARTLESTGHTSDAVDEYLRVSYEFPDFPAIAAGALHDAGRLARARGEKDRAARIEQALRKSFPTSPWVQKLDQR
jgi:lipopolysaccharide biosynthesis regulator YciM